MRIWVFMRKIVVVFVLTVVFKNAMAQVQWGIDANLNYSFIKAKDQIMPPSIIPGVTLQNMYAPASTGIMGFSAGVWMNTGDVFDIQPELSIVANGSSFVFDLNGQGRQVSVVFTNLQLPLLLGVKIGGLIVDLDVVAGPVFEINLAKKNSFTSEIEGAYPTFGAYKNKFLGLQYGVSVGLDNFKLNCRYENSLHDLDDNFEQRAYVFYTGLSFRFW